MDIIMIFQKCYNFITINLIYNIQLINQSRMQSGARIQTNQQNKNSFAPNNFENEFLSEYQESQYSEQQSSIPNNNPEVKDQTQSKDNNSHIKGQFNVDVIGKNDSQAKAIKKVNNNLDKLSKSISALKEEYKDINWDEKMFNKRDIKKEQEIKQFLVKKKKEKKQRQQKLQKIRERQQKKRQEVFIQQTQQMRKKPIQRSIVKSKQDREQDLQKSQIKTKEVSQLMEKYKEKKPFHERKMEEDEKQKKQWELKFKENLLSIHQKYKPLDQQQIQQHQRKHDQYLASIQKVKRSEKQEMFMKIIEQNNKLQANLYRGNAHEIIEQEKQIQMKKKKRPREQIEKIKKYNEYVRENFIPVPRTYDHKKSMDISLERSLDKSNASSKSHRQVKRYRFFQGVNFGEIIENRKIAKSQAEQRKMGNLYLNQLKSLPKKKNKQKSPQFSPGDLEMIQHKLHNIVKMKKQRNPLYDHSKKKNLNMKVSSNPTRQQLQVLMLELKGRDEQMKMKEKVIRSQRHGNVESVQQKQKQVNQGIIDNIERKLSLLSQL